jgi:hypothetical protein
MMRPMNRIEVWTLTMLVGAGVALFDLSSGWTFHGSPLATTVVLVLLAASLVLFGAMVIAGRRDRRRSVGPAPDAQAVLAWAAHSIRWSGAFAVSFAVVLFANCSSGVSNAPAGQSTGPPVGPVPLPPSTPVVMSGALGDVHTFLVLSSVLLGPLLVALVVPPALATAAQILAANRPQAARRAAGLIVWASAIAAGVALVSVPVGFIFGVSACDVGTGAAGVSGCAAGLGSLMNVFSVASLALFLPYTTFVMWALARMDYDRKFPARTDRAETG